MVPISSVTSNKCANMSLVCAALVVCHHFAVIGEPGGGLWWFAKLLGQGNLGLGGGLSWVAVPWFFLASGFFLSGHMDEDGWWVREVVKRIRSLVIPFFFWCVAGIVLLSLMDVSQGRSLFFGSLKAVLKGIGVCPGNIVNPMVSQLWYVRALFVLVVVSPIIFRFIGVWWLVGTFILYAVVAPFDGAEFHIFFRYGFSLEGLFYFSLGVFFRTRPIKSVGNFLFLMGGVLGVGLLLIHSIAFLYGVDVTNFVNWIATPFLLCGIWAILPNSHLPKYLTSVAFPIYLLHRFFWWPMNGLMRKILGTQDLPVDVWVIAYYLVLGVVCPIGVTWVCRKYLPRFARLVFGGR